MKEKLLRLANIIVYGITYYLSKTIYIVFFRIQVRGRENMPQKGACILASNHASFLDPPIVGTSHSREMYYFARSTLMDTPFTRTLFRLLNCIPVDRENLSMSTLKKGLAVLKEGHPLLLFPEGTRSETGELQKGKMGLGFIAHKAKVPIVPFYIHGSYDILPKGSKWPHFSKLRVNIGQPMNFDALYSQKGKDEIYQKISDEVMIRIAALKDELFPPANPVI
jgi:1-acyl-sn-glycerol-3-phosphate acyltransferase